MDETNRAYLTKEAIRQALLRQIEHKDISRVKVADLVSDAHVSKATFYRYYKDTYDLLVDCFTTYLEVKDEIDEATSHGDLVEQQHRLTLLGVEKIREYPQLFLMCHKCSYDPFTADFASRSIFRSIDATAHYISQQGITQETCLISVEQLATLCVDISTAIHIRWVTGGCSEEPLEVAELSSVCIERLVASMRIEKQV